jgi:GGDEF domain-containing protein
MGLASYPEDGLVGQELIELAETTMRRAKKKGKNRIELA